MMARLPVPFPSLVRWPPALLALVLHLLAWTLTLPLAWLMARLGADPGPVHLVAIQAPLAAILSRGYGQPGWWQFINLIFFPALLLASGAGLPSHWYLLGFLALAATSLGAVFTRVPLYLSSRRAMAEVARRLPENTPTRLVDLGCGLGGLLAHLSHARPRAVLHGVDAAPLPWLVSRLRLGRRAQIRYGSLWDENLADYDVVYAYLSPAPMARLWDKARREMRPGSLLISNTFAVPGVAPDETVELDDFSRARLLLWRMR